AGAFSFYPSKNLGACRDAGAITTDDKNTADAAISLRHSGRKPDNAYTHIYEGSTLRMDAIQAAILRVKLRHLNEWTQKRRAAAAMYDEGLKGLPVKTPPPTAKNFSQSFYVYTIKAPKRDGLMAYLKEQSIGSAVYYPTPLYRQPVYEGLKLDPAQFPHAEKAAQEVLSLPMFPEITAEQIGRVCEAVKKFYG
ncbi:MAG: DegT/DnrJ/EryC1/StrS family aminotransferase, partial [Elusimicrobia bacterium]|nr:DegT/DnrJ/EryC1/StrS family aminotransferase [Elusimicrobiota bacterium]